MVHHALHMQMPMDLGSLAWLCSVRPASTSPIWPGCVAHSNTGSADPHALLLRDAILSGRPQEVASCLRSISILDGCWERLFYEGFSTEDILPPPSSANITARPWNYYNEDCISGVLQPGQGMRQLGCIFWLTVGQYLEFDYFAFHMQDFQALSEDGAIRINWRDFEEDRVRSISGCYGNPLINEGGMDVRVLDAWRELVIPDVAHESLRGSHWASRTNSSQFTSLIAWCARFLEPGVEIGSWQHAQLSTCLQAAAHSVHEHASRSVRAGFCSVHVPRACDAFRLPVWRCRAMLSCSPSEDVIDFVRVLGILSLGYIMRSSSVQDALFRTDAVVNAGLVAEQAVAAMQGIPITAATVCLLCVLLLLRLCCAVCSRPCAACRRCCVLRAGVRSDDGAGFRKVSSSEAEWSRVEPGPQVNKPK